VSHVYFIAVTLHVLAAVAWLGGMFFFAIAAPVLRRIEDEDVRVALFDSLGRRFRLVGWVFGLAVRWPDAHLARMNPPDPITRLNAAECRR
jgi:uncharacterized membrane protein